jgi:4-amino-4-deoxy-L-arabinose transferase-like glycosyltransferase
MLVLFCLILLLPPYVEAAGYVLSENLAEFMLIAAFASVAIWRETEKVVWMVIAGAALGYAALTRPTFQYLAFAFAGCLHMSAVLRLVHGKLPSLMRASAILLVVSTTLIAHTWFRAQHEDCGGA